MSYVDMMGLDAGDLVFFGTSLKGIPKHVGFDMGYGILMFSTNYGKVVSYSLDKYLKDTGYVVLGYGDIKDYIDPNDFIFNITSDIGAKKIMEENYVSPNDSGGEGTRCVDIIRYGLGYRAFTKLKKDIINSFYKNRKSYRFSGVTPYNPIFWRRNSTYYTFLKLKGKMYDKRWR